MQRIKGTTITITKGDTLNLSLEITLPDGNPYLVKQGDEIRFALKRGYDWENVLIRKVIPHDTMTLRIEASETKRLMPCYPDQAYVYDIQITMEDGTVDTIIAGRFIVEPEVE